MKIANFPTKIIFKKFKYKEVLSEVDISVSDLRCNLRIPWNFKINAQK